MPSLLTDHQFHFFSLLDTLTFNLHFFFFVFILFDDDDDGRLLSKEKNYVNKWPTFLKLSKKRIKWPQFDDSIRNIGTKQKKSVIIE